MKNTVLFILTNLWFVLFSYGQSNVPDDNQKKAMKMHKCEYLIRSNDSWQCQNRASYECNHCLSWFCLKHGQQHQQVVKEEIKHRLNEVKVSHVHIKSVGSRKSRNFWNIYSHKGMYSLIRSKDYFIPNYCIFIHLKRKSLLLMVHTMGY